MTRKPNGSTAAPPPARPAPKPESHKSRARRRAHIEARLEDLERAEMIVTQWVNDFQVRVHRTGTSAVYDFWTSTTSWRLLGSGSVGSRGWPQLMKALGLESQILPEDK